MPLTRRQMQTVLWSAVAVAIVALLLVLGPVLTPFITAAILAYMLEPGTRWLASHRVPRWLATLLMVALAALAILSLALVLLPIVQQEIALIRARLPDLLARITDEFLPWLQVRLGMDLQLDVAVIRTWVVENLSGIGDDIAAKVFAYARSGWGAALQILSLVLLVPVVTYFLLVDYDQIMAQIKGLIPLRWRAQTDDLASEVDGILGQYLRGQMRVVAVLAVYYSIALAIAGFDLWLPIGVLSGLLIAIPYLGFALSATFALIDGMLQLGVLRGAVSVAIIYGIAQVVESTYLTPRLVGERIGLHPVVVIFSLLAFGSVFGFVGVLLALPLAAISAVALRRVGRAYRASEFFTRDDGPDGDTRRLS